MTRPRWHDVLIIAAIVGVFVVGVCALWWDDVRGLLNLSPAEQETEQAPITGPSGQT